MTWHYKDGTARREIDGVYYKDGTTLRTIQTAWYKDGATLREVYSAALLVATWTAPGGLNSVSPGTFVDHSGTTRYILSLARSGSDIALVLTSTPTSADVPNNDNVFISLTIGSTTLLRSAGVYYSAILPGLTRIGRWTWRGKSSLLPTSGTRQITIK